MIADAGDPSISPPSGPLPMWSESSDQQPAPSQCRRDRRQICALWLFDGWARRYRRDLEMPVWLWSRVASARSASGSQPRRPLPGMLSDPRRPRRTERTGFRRCPLPRSQRGDRLWRETAKAGRKLSRSILSEECTKLPTPLLPTDVGIGGCVSPQPDRKTPCPLGRGVWLSRCRDEAGTNSRSGLDGKGRNPKFPDAAAAHAEILVYDCRGHGRSDKPVAPYAVEGFADDLADLLDHVGWSAVTVAGASMGGCVAIAFAAAYPERVAGLGLIDTTCWYGPDAPAQWRERAQKALDGGMAALTGFQTSRWFDDAFRNEHPDVVEAVIAVFLANDLAAYAAACRMLGAVDKRDALPDFDFPCRIVVGAKDYATPVEMARAMQVAISEARLRIIEGARHAAGSARNHRRRTRRTGGCAAIAVPPIPWPSRAQGAVMPTMTLPSPQPRRSAPRLPVPTASRSRRPTGRHSPTTDRQLQSAAATICARLARTAPGSTPR